MDNVRGTSARDNPLFAMSGDGTDDVSIPMLFVFERDSKILLRAIEEDPEVEITMMESMRESTVELRFKSLDLASWIDVLFLPAPALCAAQCLTL